MKQNKWIGVGVFLFLICLFGIHRPIRCHIGWLQISSKLNDILKVGSRRHESLWEFFFSSPTYSTLLESSEHKEATEVNSRYPYFHITNVLSSQFSFILLFLWASWLFLMVIRIPGVNFSGFFMFWGFQKGRMFSWFCLEDILKLPDTPDGNPDTWSQLKWLP